MNNTNTFPGAYHCNKTVNGLWSMRDEIPDFKIAGYCFSEASGGKSRCDTVIFQAILI